MNRLTCNLATATAKCSELENRTGTSQASQVSTEETLEFVPTKHQYKILDGFLVELCCMLKYS